MKITTIYFDMDGTIADFYGVQGWLAYLEASDTTPYALAKPLLNFSLLARLLNQVQKMGVRIGIITALSKTGTEEYNERVTAVKREWLKKHLPSVHFDEFHAVSYFARKYDSATDKTALLFDDEQRHHTAWGGTAYFPTDIFNILKNLVREK